MNRRIAFALASLLALFATAEETWTMENPRAWARDKDSIKLEELPKAALATTFGNGLLSGYVGDTGFEVTDKRTGRTWCPAGGRLPEVEEIARMVDDDGTVRMTYIHSESLARWNSDSRDA